MISALLALLASVFTLPAMITPARAADVSPDASAASSVGSLTITAQIKDAGTTRYLAGDTYSVAWVAAAQLGPTGTIASLSTRAPFRSMNRNWTALTSSQFNTAAKELASYAGAHRLYDVTTHAVTDSDGTAVISDLQPGLYLVSRTGIAKANAAYKCDAFLVAVPETNDGAAGGVGTANYSVVAAPKFERTATPVPPTTNRPGGQPTPGITPQTGNTQTNAGSPSNVARTGAEIMRYVEAAVILGAAAVILLFIRDRFRDRRRDRDR
ncbi:prealbumin-like fold domain-containing protein [Bifidobacterium margollesii]|nr:prealbumin-like fold domain-containing protein [Bifidobacterium margollesii]